MVGSENVRMGVLDRMYERRGGSGEICISSFIA